jgi:2'-5' RNA ligase
LGVKDLTGGLHSLAEAVSKASHMPGIVPDDKPFSPHITLGRTKKGGVEIPTSVTDCLEPVKQTVEHNSFVLYRSDLSQNGPIYTPLGEFFLEK